MATTIRRRPHERNPGPYPADRSCTGCGATLSRNNPGTVCAPCNQGEWQEGEGIGAPPATVTQLRTERLQEMGAAA